MPEFYVYVHRRADTGVPFYVGKGKGDRCTRATSRNRHWHNVVAKAGAFEVEVVVDRLDEELAFLAEIELIDKLCQCGVKLVNATSGGEGVCGFTRKPPPEEIERRAASNRGKKRTPEQCERIAAAKRGHGVGRTQTPETIERRVGHLRGKARPANVVSAMQAALRAARQPQIDAIRSALRSDPRLNQTHLARQLRCGRVTIRRQRALLLAQGEI